MDAKITLRRFIPWPELVSMLEKIHFRGVYDNQGRNIHPYKQARFSLVKIHPQPAFGMSPEIQIKNKREILFSPQPTIYQNQLEIMRALDDFLHRYNTRLSGLTQGVEYEWEGRGIFHVLPPIIEKHTYNLRKGFVDLDKLSERFRGCYIKDANAKLHPLSKRYLRRFHIDEVSTVDHFDIFNSNAELINYGLRYTGPKNFHVVCDGSHRLDYSIEHLDKPSTAILVEGKIKPLLPYYAFPVPFHPTIRLSSKRSEKMYAKLERDKIHLLSDLIKKVLHYEWSSGGLNVSSLRSMPEIY